ncbi:MAG: translation initiation factor IF-2 [Patescibacteria group bacterium]|nr:translation initiation factor IF-2 [Patescibacteria group bacterium]
MVKKNIGKTNKSEDLIYPPVVAVLGHVDHGKTTLLDAIRKTSIALREHGGITQKIGASSVEITHEGKKRNITFIDTPGHEAFSLMRGRGVAAADIGLLVVSAVDGVMPQTKESIRLLQASKVPFIVVLTKSDDPNKNPEKAKQQLLKEEVLLENYGGDIPVIEVSAKTNTNIKELLELILLVFDMRKHSGFYKFSSNNPFSAIVIESKLDQKSGPRATLIVKNGTIFLRDEIVCTDISGRVRTIINDLGQRLEKATVGEAVEILGFEEVPKAGEIAFKKSEKAAEELPVQIPVSEAEEGGVKELGPNTDIDTNVLSVIICADSQGALEAIVNKMPERIKIAMAKTGDIETSDVLFAKSVGAIILGFNIKIKPEVIKLAATEKIILKNYLLIYEMMDEIQDLLDGKILSLQEEVFGTAKVLARFPFEKTEVMGIVVTDGRIARGDRVRVMRGEEVIGEANISSVRQGKETVSKVEKGQEAGIILSPFLDFTIGDVLISHR